MTSHGNAPAIEPSAEAIQAARECLHQMGFRLSPEAARDLIRAVLDIEAARLDRRAWEAAAARLRTIQESAREALAILSAAPAAALGPLPAPAVPRAPAAAPPRDKPANLAEIVRQRLADDAPHDPPALRPHEALGPPPPSAPSPPSRAGAEPRRPVFKRPRGR